MYDIQILNGYYENGYVTGLPYNFTPYQKSPIKPNYNLENYDNIFQHR